MDDIKMDNITIHDDGYIIEFQDYISDESFPLAIQNSVFKNI